MRWKIVTDSASDLRSGDIVCDALEVQTVPFYIRIEQSEYIDDETLDTAEMLAAMERSREIGKTACPAPAMWADAFSTAENVVALTISQNLSGSYSSALSGRELALAQQPQSRIAVIDSRSTGPEMALCAEHIAAWIREGAPLETIRERALRLLEETKTVFALSSFDNLVKNGRMSRFAGFVARRLGMWGVGIGSPEGRIEMKGKARGIAGMIAIILEDMQQRGFTGREVIISHCHNIALAEHLRQKVAEKWQTARITIRATRGLDSFYAERGGLIVAFW